MRFREMINEAGVTETPRFKAWFAGSKVTDAVGKPLRVYHGTDMAFAEFKKGIVPPLGPSDNQGFYFTTDPQYATNYGDIIMPVYLRMTQPYTAPNDGYEHTAISPARRAELESQGYDGIIFSGTDRPSELIVFRASQVKSAITFDAEVA